MIEQLVDQVHVFLVCSDRDSNIRLVFSQLEVLNRLSSIECGSLILNKQSQHFQVQCWLKSDCQRLQF